ncbi:histidine triad nucleotide-binding protein 3-like [Siniperca chuatsi]|uniref:histidine triad nucleotide-binding protein 3-like n=1 Tax=Siniperca chuatsi TaxID=119488 RepID=UPI001CE07445|nr:histidine triad nucleotide-binding protein 3-like [Siniperca chuatsi]
MAGNESDLSKEIDETCIFCLIANDQDKETEVIKKSKELVCFRDIYPAAPHHYLVVPIQHIHSCYSLHRGHISLVKQMVEMGNAVLQDQGITDMKDIRMGFHQPPYTSVDHLHLHVLAPTSKISEYMQYKFIPGTDRFVTAQFLQKHLKKNIFWKIVERMVEMGGRILEKNKVSDLDDVRMGVSSASILICSPPPPPRSGSSQSNELQVAASLRASVSLVHHSRQRAFSAED